MCINGNRGLSKGCIQHNISGFSPYTG
jgi:hypothetical protein